MEKTCLFSKGDIIRNKETKEILIVEDCCTKDDEFCYTNQRKIKKEHFDKYESISKNECVRLNFVELTDSLMMIDNHCIVKENFIRFEIHKGNNRIYSEYNKCYMTVYFKDHDDKLELMLTAECNKEFGLSLKEIEKIMIDKFLKTIQNKTVEDIKYDNLPW